MRKQFQEKIVALIKAEDYVGTDSFLRRLAGQGELTPVKCNGRVIEYYDRKDPGGEAVRMIEPYNALLGHVLRNEAMGNFRRAAGYRKKAEALVGAVPGLIEAKRKHDTEMGFGR